MPQPVAGAEETVTEDGWRGSAPPHTDLAALRAALDRIDDTIHDLLMERAGIVEQVARSGKPAAFRPGREASIVRRLVGRHRGALPRLTLFRIWRELLAGTTGMQAGFSVAICDPGKDAAFTQLAREHFGAMTPSRQHPSAAQALADVSHHRASVAVMPFPSDTETWWTTLRHHEPRLHVIGRLPFWRRRPEGTPTVQALVVAATAPDASGDDRTLIALECDSEASSTRVANALAGGGLGLESLLLLRDPRGGPSQALIEVGGFLTDGDARLHHLDSVLRRPAVLGSYAVPFPEDLR
ncbi:MAG TPA: chorismate mutase [Rhodopila sp.]|nr:chorismate mutase [Rhodopila sp.]